MKPLHFFLTAGAVIVLTIVARPARPASAHYTCPGGQCQGRPAVFQEERRVTASAVLVPTQISELGFVVPGLVKEVLFREGDLVKAGDVLITLDAPEMQFAVTAAEAALRSAQGNAELQRYARVKNVRNGKVFWDELPGELRELANIRVMQTQAALEIAQATLAQSILTAPYDATVAEIHIVPGEYVGQNQIVITLAMLNTLQLETTDLSERDITNVRLGDSANIMMEAFDTQIGGEVVGISPMADTVGGDVVFKVIIELNEQPKGLLWGMTAEVTIGE